MRKNKQMMSLVLAAAMAASLAGCSSSKPAETKSDSSAAPASEAAESSASAGEGTTITYVTLGDTGMELLKQAAEEFKAETGI